jgi:hypothetical protein
MEDATAFVLELPDTLPAADVFAQAFMEDPLVVYMLPNQHTRQNEAKGILQT